MCRKMGLYVCIRIKVVTSYDAINSMYREVGLAPVYKECELCVKLERGCNYGFKLFTRIGFKRRNIPCVIVASFSPVSEYVSAAESLVRETVARETGECGRVTIYKCSG